MDKLSILGSTGSIGRQALEIIRFHKLRPTILTARKNIALLEAQAREFLPDRCYVSEPGEGRQLRLALADTPIKVSYGQESICEAAAHHSCQTVLNALVGISGLHPTLAALDSGKRLLLANKESLVYGGELVTRRAQTPIIPVDSEHSAIFQCLQGGGYGLKRIILTASGGPFRGYTNEQLRRVAPQDALRHPNWNMGAKVTVDSATLLNKGLELIEAIHLFSLKADEISVIIHKQSIIHSMVEYNDGAVIAQLGTPDMRLPIQYALFYPLRKPCPGEPLKLDGELTFEPPDLETFPCLTLAIRAAKQGGNAGAILSAAGEGAVESFLNGNCSFTDIPERIQKAQRTVAHIKDPSLRELEESAQIAYRMSR
ncbi:MAG: 1-deoxy-D-xylulose-5-phosphate reductoisomerase [Oscillospiraceae bacterium]|nr:1-deoxy-D-xylulose-5-phosphate reductoisomerase [Oscillospiraceae bacterium]